MRRRCSRFLQLAEDRFQRLDDVVTRRPRFGEAQFEVERLGGRPVRENVVLRAAGLLARGAALTCDLLDKAVIFHGILANYL